MNGKDVVAVLMAVNKLDGPSFTAKDEEVRTSPTWEKHCSFKTPSLCVEVFFLFLPDLKQISELRQPAAESFPPELPAQL